MCDFCEKDKMILNNRERDTGFEVYIDDNMLNIFACLRNVVTVSGDASVKINFCPMCGRRLEDV